MSDRLEDAVAAVWAEVLGRPDVPDHDRTFFELGGRSVMLGPVREGLRAALGVEVPVSALLRHPTVAALAGHLRSGGAGAPGRAPASGGTGDGAAAPNRAPATGAHPGDALAITGMACRFPGADTPERFWELLRSGGTAVRSFDRAELLGAGVPAAVVDDPRHVPSGGHLEGADLFDAEAFGLSPLEARATDPQHRLFWECAWEALESAGMDPRRLRGADVGCFGGVGMALNAGPLRDTYLSTNLATDPELLAALPPLRVSFANDPDHTGARLAYALGLRGPAVAVQTACSTSLVALHLACRALRAGDCGTAVVAAAAVHTPFLSGHLHHEGGILSPDGVCRVFDADSRGTVGGNGAGAVVLRRLADALADGDPVLAVVRGTAINNDGADRMGYAAPSSSGQAAVIRAALADAGLSAADVGYVEAHGTGTELGDLVELTGLAEAFDGVGRGRCGLGSAKPVTGHLDTAAGMAGLIKAVLALRHGELPPLAHHRTPAGGLAQSPFFVPTTPTAWPGGPGRPRVAGVSSFGAGGTNAHAVLQEPPPRGPAAAPGPGVVLVSGRDGASLRATAASCARHLRDNPEEELSGVSATTLLGRPLGPHRVAVVAEDVASAAAGLERFLEGRAHRDVVTGVAGAEGGVAFAFSGQGGDVVGATAELLRHDPVFAAAFADCDRLLPGARLRAAVEADAAELRTSARLAQPLLLSFQHALTALWRACGVEPTAVLGHSLGEYGAAVTAGVLDLGDALELVAERGALMDERGLPGVMSAVRAEADRVAEAVARARGQVEIAAVNGPRDVVVAGDADAVAEVVRLLGEDAGAVPVPTTNPFHCAAVEPVLAPFGAALARRSFRAATLPILSAVDARHDGLLDGPGYWRDQVRLPVRFHDAVTRLLRTPPGAVLEIGPGAALTSASTRAGHDAPTRFLASVTRGRVRPRLLTAYATLLVLGAADPERHPCPPAGPVRRATLPPSTRPRRSHWVGPPPGPRAQVADSATTSAASQGTATYENATPDSATPENTTPDSATPDSAVPDSPASGAPLPRAQPTRTRPTLPTPQTRDTPDEGPAVLDVHWQQAPAPAAPARGALRWLVVGAGPTAADLARRARARGDRVRATPAHDPEHLNALLAGGPGPWRLLVVADAEPATRGALAALAHLAEHPPTAAHRVALVTGPDAPGPEALAALARTALAELPDLSCSHLALDDREDAAAAFAELLAEDGPPVLRLRGGGREIPALRPRAGTGRTALDPSATYLVTGAGGALGGHVLTWLAEAGARHVLAIGGRTGDARGLAALRGLDVLHARLDLADRRRLTALLAHARRVLPPLGGVVHAAGALADTTLTGVTDADLARAAAPKLPAARLVHELTGDQPLAFAVAFSSTASLLGAAGQAAYAVANADLDELMRRRRAAGLPGTTVHWGPWSGAGMAANSGQGGGIEPRAGIAALDALVASGAEHVCVLPAHDPRAGGGPLDRPPAPARRGRALPAPPRTAVELAGYLRGVVATVTGVEPGEIADEAGFAELGVDSLTGLRMRELLVAGLGVPLPATYLYRHSTIADLAGHLATASPTAPQRGGLA
ncbi:type I polyketide synthase [Actinosynnema pretiosum]|uniref:type I polyketide synthase n=1 Tax=Actinosynnema pretiosum TaxID=42197 RepID=UPI0015A54823|nr:type I polyketide synthase [Actinosynnema pretiosum]